MLGCRPMWLSCQARFISMAQPELEPVQGLQPRPRPAQPFFFFSPFPLNFSLLLLASFSRSPSPSVCHVCPSDCHWGPHGQCPHCHCLKEGLEHCPPNSLPKLPEIPNYPPTNGDPSNNRTRRRSSPSSSQRIAPISFPELLFIERMASQSPPCFLSVPRNWWKKSFARLLEVR